MSRVTDVARKWCEGIFMSFVYLLAIVGAVRVRRDFAVLAVVLVTYQTLAAIVFAGTTRYRVPWDFLLVLIAASGLSVLTSRAHTNRSAPYAPDSVISDSTSA